MGNFGATEILIVLVIGFLLFGRSRLPGMGRKASDQLRQTKDAVGEAKDEFKLGLHEVDDPSTPLKETMRDAKPRPSRGTSTATPSHMNRRRQRKHSLTRLSDSDTRPPPRTKHRGLGAARYEGTSPPE